MPFTFNALSGKFDYYKSSPAETDPVFSASEAASFAAGDAAKLAGIEAGAEVNNISDVNATDLTDGGDTTLHDHDGISENTAARHTQGTDQGLDTGGANAVTATQAKSAYTHSGVTTGNPHSVTKTEVGLGSVNDSSTTNGMWESSGGNTQLKTADDVDFAKYKAIQMCCDNGTSFPASPNTGQWFYRSDIDTLFIYEAAWKAIISFGAVTMYVDGTNGSDAVGQGYATGAGATATIQYAIDLLPAVNGGNVIINVAVGTYNTTASINIQGKAFSGAYTLKIIGAMSEAQAELTANSATAYASGVQATFTDTGAFAGDVFAFKVLRITGGTGYQATAGLEWENDYVIESHTDDVLTIIGNWWSGTPNSTTTYKVMDFATIIDGGATAVNGIRVLGGQKAVKIYQMKIQAVTYACIDVFQWSYCDLYTVYLTSTVAGAIVLPYRGFCIAGNINCLILDAASSIRGMYLDYFSQTLYSVADVYYGLTNSYLSAANSLNVNFHSELGYNNLKGNKYINNGTAGTACVYSGFHSFIEFAWSIIEGNSVAKPNLLIQSMSAVRLWAGNEIKNCGSDGIQLSGMSTLSCIQAGTKVTNNGGWGLNTTENSFGGIVSTRITFNSANLTGTISCAATAVVGVGTAFTTELVVGDVIGNSTTGWRRVTVITDNTNCTVDSAYSVAPSGSTYNKGNYSGTYTADASSTNT